MDERMVNLRKYLSLVHVPMNRSYGYEVGKKGDLSPNGVYIVYLCHFYRLRMKDIAEKCGVSKSSITESVDTLEKKGYIRRVRGDKDRRDIYIEPTEKANEWVMRTETNIHAFMEASLARLTPEEQGRFLELFGKFVGEGESIPYDVLFEHALKAKLKEK